MSVIPSEKLKNVIKYRWDKNTNVSPQDIAVAEYLDCKYGSLTVADGENRGLFYLINDLQESHATLDEIYALIDMIAGGDTVDDLVKKIEEERRAQEQREKKEREERERIAQEKKVREENQLKFQQEKASILA